MVKSKKEAKVSLGISCETTIQFYDGMDLINKLVGAVLYADCLGVINEDEFALLNNAIWDYPNDKQAMAKVFRDITGYSMRFIIKD